jgi:polar amino acid transport system substrate-binding protein
MTNRGSDRAIDRTAHRFRSLIGGGLATLGLGGCLAAAICAYGAEQHETGPLRIAVYDVPPYGYVDTDGSISGVSVDLWRRVAERMEREFKLIPVADMESILGGLEQGRFDAAIGAITITPEREERVDFSYPAHRSGVAVALRKQSGPLFALMSYGAAVFELGFLILAMLTMLVLIGIAMWFIERPVRSGVQGSESSVVTLRDGLYWAVVTMTTVGYGDKTPKTTIGRAVAILWMLGSVVLVSLLSTSLVSRLTADREKPATPPHRSISTARNSRRWLSPRARSISTSCISATPNSKTCRKLWMRSPAGSRTRSSTASVLCSI